MPLSKVIRAKCLDCSCGQVQEVAKCTAVRCPLWPYRMGKNPFSTRSGRPDAFRKKPLDSSRGRIASTAGLDDLVARPRSRRGLK